MKAVILAKSGNSKILSVTETDISNPTENQIQLKVKYSGVNYADILSRKGLYSWSPKRPYIMGLEAAGEVVKKGSNVTDLEIGDRVIYGGQSGGYAEYINIDQSLALPAPEQFNWKECAAFGVTFFTSWIALHEMARVRENETLLVHSAAGGVGTATIQLAKAHNMKIYGTTSSESKFKTIEDLGATPLKYTNFDTELLNNNIRPDCIIETVGGDVYTRGFEILAPMGRVVLVGVSSIKANKRNPFSMYKAWKALPKTSMGKVLRRSRGFMGVHLGYLLSQPEKLRPSWLEMLKVIEEHNLRPTIRDDHIFPMTEVGTAHDFIDNRKNIGKVLLDPTK